MPILENEGFMNGERGNAARPPQPTGCGAQPVGRAGRCSTGKRFPVLELPLQCWKTISNAGVATAVLENDFQCRSCHCSTGKRFPVQKLPLQYWKTISSAEVEFLAVNLTNNAREALILGALR